VPETPVCVPLPENVIRTIGPAALAAPEAPTRTAKTRIVVAMWVNDFDMMRPRYDVPQRKTCGNHPAMVISVK
jgi:hypothetical protein